jgi:hypothetical protein
MKHEPITKAQELEHVVADLSRNCAALLMPVSKMAAQISCMVLATPCAALALPPAQGPTAANPFGGGGGGGRGNLFAGGCTWGTVPKCLRKVHGSEP